MAHKDNSLFELIQQLTSAAKDKKLNKETKDTKEEELDSSESDNDIQFPSIIVSKPKPKIIKINDLTSWSQSSKYQFSSTSGKSISSSKSGTPVSSSKIAKAASSSKPGKPVSSSKPASPSNLVNTVSSSKQKSGMQTDIPTIQITPNLHPVVPMVHIPVTAMHSGLPLSHVNVMQQNFQTLIDPAIHPGIQPSLVPTMHVPVQDFNALAAFNQGMQPEVQAQRPKVFDYRHTSVALHSKLYNRPSIDHQHSSLSYDQNSSIVSNTSMMSSEKISYPNLDYPNVENRKSEWNFSNTETKKSTTLKPPPEPHNFKKETSPDYRTHKANMLKKKRSPEQNKPSIRGPQTPPMPPPVTPPLGPRTPPLDSLKNYGPQTPPMNDGCRNSPQTPPHRVIGPGPRTPQTPPHRVTGPGPRTPPYMPVGPRTPPLGSGPRTPPLRSPQTPPNLDFSSGSQTPPSPYEDESPPPKTSNERLVNSETYCSTNNACNGPKTPPMNVITGPKTPPSPPSPETSSCDSPSPIQEHCSPSSANEPYSPPDFDVCESKVTFKPCSPSSPKKDVSSSAVIRRNITLLRRKSRENQDPDSESSSSETPDTSYPDYRRKSTEDSPEPQPKPKPERPLFGLVEVEENEESSSEDSELKPFIKFKKSKKKKNTGTKKAHFFPTLDSDNEDPFFLKDPFLQKDLGDGLNKNHFKKNVNQQKTEKEDPEQQKKTESDFTQTKNIKHTKHVKHTKEVKRTTDVKCTMDFLHTTDIKHTKNIKCTKEVKRTTQVKHFKESPKEQNGDSASDCGSSNNSAMSLESGEVLSDSDINEIENENNSPEPMEEDKFIKYSDYEELLNMEKKRMLEDEMIRNEPVEIVPQENGSPILYDMSDSPSEEDSSSSSSESEEEEAKTKFPRYFKDKVSYDSQNVLPHLSVDNEQFVKKIIRPKQGLPRFGDTPIVAETKETKTPLIKRLGLVKPVVVEKESETTPVRSVQPAVEPKPGRLIRKLVVEDQGKFTKVKLASPVKSFQEGDSKVFAEVIKPKKEKRQFATPKKRRPSNRSPVKKMVKKSPSRLDLDSRLQIMFGNKYKKSPQKYDPDTPVRYHFRNFPPLRRAPSPFRSRTVYLYWHRETYYYRKHNPKPPEDAVDPFHRRKIGIQIKQLEFPGDKEDVSSEETKLTKREIEKELMDASEMFADSPMEDQNVTESSRKEQNHTSMEVSPTKQLKISPTKQQKKSPTKEQNQSPMKQQKVTVVDVQPDVELELAVQSQEDEGVVFRTPSLPKEQLLVNMVISKLLDEFRSSLKRKLTEDILNENSLTEEDNSKRQKLDS